MQVGWITPSQCFFSVEMPEKDTETKELRENIIALLLQLYSEGGSHVLRHLFPPMNVSLSCQDRVQKSLEPPR